jgi:uncharacterized protein (TIGR02145 family)
MKTSNRNPYRFPFLFISALFLSIILFTCCGKKDDDDSTKGLPELITLEITQVTTSTALSGGEIISEGASNVTQKGVCWSTNPEPTVQDGITADGSGIEIFTSDITRLSASTTYYVRAYATNSRGTSYGNERVFTTFHGVVTDVDGNSYGTVLVGDQEWMAQDLRTTKYRNSSPITTGLNNIDWQTASAGAFSVYPYTNVDGIDSVEQMLTTYGALYNGYAVTNPNGLCPTGWRVPTDDDWTTLVDYLVSNYSNVSSANVGNALKSCRQINSPLADFCDTQTHPRWKSSENHYGTNIVNFTALPSGTRQTSGSYSFIGEYGLYWSSTLGIPGFAFRRQLYHNAGDFNSASLNMRSGFSVRCVKN